MKTGCRRTALSTVGQSELHPGDGLEVRHFGRTRFLPNWQPAPIKAPAFLPWGSRRLAVRGRLAGGGRRIRTSGSWSDLRRRDALPTGPRLPRPTCWIQFAVDSLLEGDGFESPVPQQIRSRFRASSHFSHDGLTASRPGTGSSNPSPSSSESHANLILGPAAAATIQGCISVGTDCT